MVAKFLDHRMAFGLGFAGIFLCLVRDLEFLEFVEAPQMHATKIPSPKMCWFFFGELLLYPPKTGIHATKM